MTKVPWREGDYGSPVPKVFVRILAPTLVTPVRGVFVDNTVFSTEVHYVDGSSTPCLGMFRLCEFCKAGCSKRTQGFVGCVCLRNVSPFILQVSAGCLSMFEAKLEQSERALRGLQFHSYRKGKRANAPQEISFEQRHPQHKIQQPFDTKKIMESIWFGGRNQLKNGSWGLDGECGAPILV